MCFSRRSVCQPGFRLAAHVGSVGVSSRMSIADGVRRNTWSSLAALPKRGMIYTTDAPVPIIPTTLSFRPGRLSLVYLQSKREE